jgi:spermidine/putrescine transport system substrate-binding protein
MLGVFGKLISLIRIIFTLFFLFMALPSLSQAGEKQELVVLTWAKYISPEVIASFEESHNAKVRFVYYASEDECDRILTNFQGKGFDIILGCGSGSDEYIRAHWLAPLDLSKIPNYQHIDPQALKAYPALNGYGVPYLQGNIGIAYRKDLVNPPRTWRDFFNPPKELNHKILTLNSTSSLLNIAMKALGYSPVSYANDHALRAAESLLMNQKQYVKRYGLLSVDKDSLLVTGEVSIAMDYNGTYKKCNYSVYAQTDLRDSSGFRP